MQGKIAFEEHLAIEETLGNTRYLAGTSSWYEELTKGLLDVDSLRLDKMDATGIEYALLSLNAPGVQAVLDTDEAIEVARKGNERIAEAAAKYPKRYGGLAALPMQDPDAASAELTRCVRELGFKGALVNGFTQKGEPDTAIYYDIPEYRGFWATVAELDVPFYLHPRMQLPSQSRNLEGHPWLKSSPWGFAAETAIHALRLCGSGLFDDYPSLKIAIGHLGETVPFSLWRVDARMRFSSHGYECKRPIGDYFRDHFHVTCSGFFDDPAFACTLEIMGADRMYFSADYPFERMEEAAEWYDATGTLDDALRRKIGRENAIGLWGLELG